MTEQFPVVWMTALSAIASAVVSASISAVVSLSISRRNHRLDYSFERTLRFAFADRKLRTFNQIARRFPGFDPDQLRHELVKAGYAAFYRGAEGAELWGYARKHRRELRK